MKTLGSIQIKLYQCNHGSDKSEDKNYSKITGLATNSF